MGVFFRRRQSGRWRKSARSFGWKGRWSRRDEPDWFAGASRFHDYNGGLHLLLRKQEELPESTRLGGQGVARAGRKNHEYKVWRQSGYATAGLGSLRRPRFNARHDGHDFEPRLE